jgi:hypothetical protein
MNYTKNVDVSLVCVGSRGWESDFEGQAGASVVVIMKERTPGCDEYRIPVLVLGVEINAHTPGQVGLDKGSYKREVGRQDLHTKHMAVACKSCIPKAGTA